MGPLTLGHQRAYNICVHMALAADKSLDWSLMKCAAILDLLPPKEQVQ
jgi:hypothetical protein